MKTSATAGKEKWIMKPKKEVKKAIMETALQSFFSVFHDGEKPGIRIANIILILICFIFYKPYFPAPWLQCISLLC